MIVKSGANFGADYSVYRDLPSKCHAEMCAYIMNGTIPYDAAKAKMNDERYAVDCQMSFRQLTTLTRVMQVSIFTVEIALMSVFETWKLKLANSNLIIC